MTAPLSAFQSPGVKMTLPNQAAVRLAGFVPPSARVLEVLGQVNVSASNNIITAIALVSTVPQSCIATPAGGSLNTTTGVATLDFPRCVQIISAGADTATVLISGTDAYGVALTQLLTLNGAAEVITKKAFMTIISMTAISATPSNNISLGTAAALGLAYKTSLGTIAADAIRNKNVSGTLSADAGTVVVADVAAITNLTGDIRGTYLPAAAEAVATTSFFVEYVVDTASPFGLNGGAQA